MTDTPPTSPLDQDARAGDDDPPSSSSLDVGEHAVVSAIDPERPEGLYRLLVESVRDYAIFALDADGNVRTWNRGAERFKGWTADEIIGRHFSTFYPAEDLAAGKPAWELEVARAEGRFEEEGWRVRKDGTQFWASVVITALRDPEGTVIGFAKVTRDLTERRASNMRALEDARRVAEAEASSRTKSEFLTAMSHELRTPLNAIGGYVDLLSMGLHGPVSESQLGALERIRRSQQHLLAVINDLLNYSRIEAGQVHYDFTAVRVEHATDAVMEMVEPQALEKAITIERRPCPPEAVAWADALKVEQILLNVLSNAVKFTPEHGRISVGCTIVDDMLELRVHDSGPGVPPDKRDAIFEPFVQLGRTLTTGHEGTGLGLAISRDLARTMGGDLLVEPVDTPGATLLLTLPRTTER